MDILLNKGAIVERCIRRVREETEACPKFDNFTHLDALILNLERACQAVIDMAMHQVASRHLGMPQGASRAIIRSTMPSITGLWVVSNGCSQTSGDVCLPNGNP